MTYALHSHSLTRVLKSLVNCRNHKEQQTTHSGVIMASNTEESSDFQKMTVLELKKYLVDRGVTVNGYNKGTLVVNNFINLLPFGLYDIFNFLICHSTAYDKQGLAAYKSFDDYRLFEGGYVESLLTKRLRTSVYMCMLEKSDRL